MWEGNKSHWPHYNDFEPVDSMCSNLYLDINNCIFIYSLQRNNFNILPWLNSNKKFVSGSDEFSVYFLVVGKEPFKSC